MKKTLASCIFAAIAAAAAMAAPPLVVFDGGKHMTGKIWVHPRGVSELKISYQHPFSNKAHLYFKARWINGWAGCGWNWKSWKGPGDDITKYKTLRFRLGVSKHKIKGLLVQLTSNDGNGADAVGPKVMLLPEIDKRGKYILFTIPLEKLIGGKLDPKNVWGINFDVHAFEKEGECKIYIDQIEFLD